MSGGSCLSSQKVTVSPVLNNRGSRKWKRYSEFENRRTLWIPVHLGGRITEKENPQRQQQSEVGPHRQDHHQRRAGPAGTVGGWAALLQTW